jgi:hypothetical protein
MTRSSRFSRIREGAPSLLRRDQEGRDFILQSYRETYRFLTASGVQLAQSNQFHYRRVVFFSQLKSKVGNILVKVAGSIAS